MGSQSESGSNETNENGSTVASVKTTPEQPISHALQLLSHGDYESLHPHIVMILMLIAVVAQIIIVQWKRHFYRVYRRVSWLIMVFVPVIISLINLWLRFIFIWMLFAVTITYISYRFSQSPMTQRYGSFLCLYGIYEVSVTVVVVGLIATKAVFSIGLLFFEKPLQTWLDFGPLTLFYGFYINLIFKGIAEIITDRIAHTIQEHKPADEEVDNRRCGLCNTPNPLQDASGLEFTDETRTLACQHTFHKVCFTVWCTMGKKRMCPRCRQVVVPEIVLGNANVFYGKLLNFVELLVSWLPLICAAQLFQSFMPELRWIYSIGRNDRSEL